MYGIFISAPCRIFACTRSLLSSRVARTPAPFSAASTCAAYALLFSLIGSTRTCSGASHTGNAPAKCSIRNPTNRSIDPNGARCTITGRWGWLSLPTYVRSNRSGRL